MSGRVIQYNDLAGEWLAERGDPLLAPDRSPPLTIDERLDGFRLPPEARERLKALVFDEAAATARRMAAEAVQKIILAASDVNSAGAAIANALGIDGDEAVGKAAERLKISKQAISQSRQALAATRFASRTLKPPDGSGGWLLFREAGESFGVGRTVLDELRARKWIELTDSACGLEKWIHKTELKAALDRIPIEAPELLAKPSARRVFHVPDKMKPSPNPSPENGNRKT